MKPQTDSKAPRFADHSLGDWLRSLVLLVAICAGIAFFSRLLNGESYWLNLRISLGFGLSIIIAINLFQKAWPGRSERLNSFLGLLVGVLIGMVHLLWIAYGNPFALNLKQHGLMILSNFAFSGVISLIVFYFFYSAYRVQRLRREISEQQLLAIQKDKELMSSQLKLIQSQIEPHFLFNTLANVQGLIDQDSTAAKRLVAELTTMLRASLKRTRQQHTLLEEELAIARSYLAIQAIRMGSRLAYRMDAPESVNTLPMPPLLVQPLIENAVIHGIEPSPEGGRIEVLVTLEGEALKICVIDNGIGIGRAPASDGEGMGLSNVRERLRLLYPGSGRLELKARPEGGTEACLWLPIKALEEIEDHDSAD